MVLYINACPREGSRTDILARALLGTLGDYTQIKLAELELQPLDGERLEYRTSLIEKGELDSEMFALSRQFASADEIVISAPYWDGSFPAVLKTYIENIYVTGIVSEYGADGAPKGLCRAKKLWYVTTAGGPYNPAFSYEYIRFLAEVMFGIEQTELVFTEFMDIYGNDPDEILRNKISEVTQ